MVGKQPKMTKSERARIEAMMKLGCVYCVWFDRFVPAQECHHIVEGNRRLGHWYTIPLCRDDHANINALTNPRNGGPSERDLWEVVQITLELPSDWPESKILPRRLG
jgi:uncharacterized protein YodC (DUF2158 family)